MTKKNASFFFFQNPLSLFLKLFSCIPSYLFYLLSFCFALTFSTGPHMEQCWSFFCLFFWNLQQSPLQGQILTMSACPPVCFQMRSWKTWWPIGQHIHQSLFHCFSYSESQQVHHFYSVFHSLPISDWPFEPCMGPVPLLSHAFFLP